jgi:two pore calcium channel protein 1
MIRPLYLIVSIRLLREYVKRYLQVIQDSLPMVIFTVVYILYFAWMGQRLFSGTLEGVQFFDSFGNSFFNMLVLMTTSNFPDIMLPAYQRNRIACLYFIIYLILGLYLMMNLLLAIFYSNFKFRFEQNIGRSE